MNSWEGLRDILSAISGVRKVYFQPPENVKLEYPCIIFERNNGKRFDANNKLYNYRKSYSVLVIDKEPDSIIPDEVLKIPFSSFNRFYVSDNLNHWSYTIYY